MDAIKEKSSIIVQHESINKETALEVATMVHDAETLLIREMTKKEEVITDLRHQIALNSNENVAQKLEHSLQSVPVLKQEILAELKEYCMQKIQDVKVAHESELLAVQKNLTNEIHQLSLHCKKLEEKNQLVSDQLSVLLSDPKQSTKKRVFSN